MENLDAGDALAMLEWQLELGADEAIQDTPIDRFAVVVAKPEPTRATGTGPPAASPPTPAARAASAPQVADPAESAKAAAQSVQDLPGLRAALEAFDGSPLKQTARQLVFSDGHASARLMIVGEAPGRDEDIQGRPFVGRAGHLLDKMFAAIGLDRHSEDPAKALYITNLLPWRPPQNRDPSPEEIAVFTPFARRHVELVDPDVLILVGNFACQGLLGQRGITRLRGHWSEAVGRPALPMFHPAYLLRKPHEKAKAWDDLLAVDAKLRGIS